MPVTRINNNQITDASAGNLYLGINAAAKLQDYSITSTKIANSLTYGSDLTIAGNLTVQGNTTTIDTVNVVVEDPLILLAAAQTGSPTLDIGFIGKRGTEDNITFVWDEAQDAFVTAFTSSEVTNTTVTINSYASFKTFNVEATGNLDVTGTSNLVGNITIGNLFVDGQKTLDMGNSIISNVQDPVANNDVATKAYVDQQSSSGFTIEDDTANTTVVSGGDTLLLLGTANEVEVSITANDEVTFGLPTDVTVAGNLNAGNLIATNDVSGATGTFSGNVDGGNLTTAGQVAATGNVSGGNLVTAGDVTTATVTASSTVTATGNVSGGNITTAGDVTTATVTASSTVTATGNVSGGNLTTAGDVTTVTVTASGNITGANLNTAGEVVATGNITGGNLNTSGSLNAPSISATGNITGGNLVTAGDVTTSTVTASSTITATGNITGGNLDTAGAVIATGNVTGGNLVTAGDVSGATGTFSGNVDADNFNATSAITAGTTIDATGNITGANLNTAGAVVATGNVTGGNINTAGQVIATGDITGGNLITAGNVDGANVNATAGVYAATGDFVGNVTAGNVTVAAGTVEALTVTATGNVNGANVNTNNIIGTGLIITSTGTLELGSTTDVIDVNGARVIDLGTPTASTDAATKQYVDDAVSSGIQIHPPVYVESPSTAGSLNATYAQGGTTPTIDSISGNVMTTSANHGLSVNDVIVFDSTTNGVTAGVAYFVESTPALNTLTLSTTYGGVQYLGLTDGTSLALTSRANSGVGATLTNAGTNAQLQIDGILLTGGERVLIYSQTNGYENGVYDVTVAGDGSTPWVLTRASDMDKYIPNSINGVDVGDYFFVQAGNTGAGESYVMTAPMGPIIIGTDNLVFTQFSASSTYSANTNAGLVLNGTVFSAKVDNDTTAFDIAGNIVVKAGANLVSPNIGDAVGNSLTLTGNGALSATTVAATGNISGGNLVTLGAVEGGTATITGNVTGGNFDTLGNMTAAYFIGNGSQLTGVAASSVNASDLVGNTLSANVLFSSLTTVGTLVDLTVDGTATVGNLSTGGTVTATGNVTGGNLVTAGAVDAATVTATGNISGGNLETTGSLGVTGNVDGGNLNTTGQVVATGNITGGNINTTGTINGAAGEFTGNVGGGNVISNGIVIATGNVSGGNVIAIGGVVSTTVVASGNVTGANLDTAGEVVATGNVTGGNLVTLGGVYGATGTFTGNVDADNFNATSAITAGTTITATGNITGGNIDTAGAVTATGNVTGGNLVTAGDVSGATGTFTGNIGGGNLSVTGAVDATGNVTGGNIVTAGDVSAATVTATGNVSGDNFIGTTGQFGNIVISGDDITDTNGRVNFNTAGDDVDFAVNGDTTANVFYIDAGTGTASFGSEVQTTGAIAAFNSTDSILIPVGNTAQRPGTGVTGMLRFNTQLDALEYFDNDSWQTADTDFTVITADSFNGDGSTVAFTLTTASTTAGTIVAINGVVQIPTIAYSVSGTTLTFTEAPEVGDIIDVRVLTTTSSVSGIEGLGGASFEAGPGTEFLVTGDLIPTANVTYDLGNSTNQWKDGWFSGTTIHLGGLQLKASGNTFVVYTADGVTQANIDAGSIDVSAISSGTSVIGISGVNGDGYITVGGVANVLVATTTGVLVNGALDVTGNVVAGNISLTGSIAATQVTGTNISGTLTTAAQPNITSVGQLTSLGVTGNVTAGNVSATNVTGTLTTAAQTNITSVGTLTTLAVSGDVSIGANILNTGANGTGNIGSSTTYFNTVFAKATSAQYADLAEMYEADGHVEPGTVVIFGGAKEVTICTEEGSKRVAGVVSTNPSYIMNSGLQGDNVVAVALTGRVPVKVTGSIRKGDMMVAAGDGRARAEANPQVGQVIGKALADFDGIDGVIEVVVGRL